MVLAVAVLMATLEDGGRPPTGVVVAGGEGMARGVEAGSGERGGPEILVGERRGDALGEEATLGGLDRPGPSLTFTSRRVSSEHSVDPRQCPSKLLTSRNVNLHFTQ